VAAVVRRFLDCGILENGFARVVCPESRAGFLVAFSCKCRYRYFRPSATRGGFSCGASSSARRSFREVLAEAFRRAVLAAFVHEGLFTPEVADSMLAWPHSGFHVHNAVRIEAGDTRGALHIARYAARAPVALSRMSYDAERATVRIRAATGKLVVVR
jgi:hypothetical protein